MNNKFTYNYKNIQNDYNLGFSRTDLSKKYGISSSALSIAVNKGLLKFRTIKEALSIKNKTRFRPKNYDWELLQKDYDSGLSIRDLKKKYGVGSQSVTYASKNGYFKTRSLSESMNNYEKVHGKKPGQGNKGNPEARERLSIEQSQNNRGGKCKWYEVSGRKVQGTWERDLAIKFDDFDIEWIKPSAGSLYTVKYEIEGKIKHYTPDFYLPEFDMFIELKGFWWGKDREKMDIVLDTYPNLRLIIVEKEEFFEALKIKPV